MEQEQIDSLTKEYYNATISSINKINDNLRVLRIKPDEPILPYESGQFTSIGLGCWEPSPYLEDEEKSDTMKIPKIVRRAYSISTPILDEKNELIDHNSIDFVEFYIAKVTWNGEEKIPLLTPRLFQKEEGTRLVFGTKITGSYNLGDIDSNNNIIFASTGTGLAPHISMLVDLLKKEHTGKILILDCNRYNSDFAYRKELTYLQEKYENFQYVELATRESKSKKYIQDFVREGSLEEYCKMTIAPENTNVFLCGNPAMIGIPTTRGGSIEFPIKNGIVELLMEKYSLTINDKNHLGQINYEKYW